MLFISFGSINYTSDTFENRGVGTESVEIVEYGSLSWNQMEAVDKARLENVAQNEKVKALFKQKAFL